MVTYDGKMFGGFKHDWITVIMFLFIYGMMVPSGNDCYTVCELENGSWKQLFYLL